VRRAISSSEARCQPFAGSLADGRRRGRLPQPPRDTPSDRTISKAGSFLGAFQGLQNIIKSTRNRITLERGQRRSRLRVRSYEGVVCGSRITTRSDASSGNRPPRRPTSWVAILTIWARNGVPLPVARWNVACAHAYQSTRITRPRRPSDQPTSSSGPEPARCVENISRTWSSSSHTNRSVTSVRPSLFASLKTLSGWNRGGHRRLPARERLGVSTAPLTPSDITRCVGSVCAWQAVPFCDQAG
jgi:hypothetical protein